MTRSMGDAIHDNVARLPAGLQLVAGYVTGSADIKWTSADWARFPGAVHVTIDQGFTGSPVETAIVRDVETGAWVPGAAVQRAAWVAVRPTIYCNRSTLPAILSGGWKGDLWLAYPGWQVGEALPAAPGCTYVAVQNQLSVAGIYDLSVVLDDTWPNGAHMPSTPAYGVPSIASVTPYVVFTVGINPPPNATPATFYHYQLLNAAGLVVADGRVEGTSIRVDAGLHPGTYKLQVAAGADSGHLASPWSAQYTVTA